MAAPSRFVTAVTALSFFTTASAFPQNPVCGRTTTTVYKTVTVPDASKPSGIAVAAKNGLNDPFAQLVPLMPSAPQFKAPGTWSIPGVSFPTFSPQDPNPNGPFYNPNNWVPEPLIWPGKPTKGQVNAPPIPTGAYGGLPLPRGGFSADKYASPHWGLKGSNAKPGLPQQDTNGGSNWGLVDCPRLPFYLDGNGKPISPSQSSATVKTTGIVSGKPSSTAPLPTGSASNNNTLSFSGFPSLSSPAPSSLPSSCVKATADVACAKMPDTGVTRKYNFNIAYQTIAPDGVQRNGIVVNGQFPGPLVEANWGDWIEVAVKNSLPESSGNDGEPTSIHWHGFFQQGTPYYDGVPSVGQNPIAPGKTMTYRFRADHVGSTWWHSHYSAQYSAGLLGPIVIHGPATECYDEDVGPVMLTDWYHKDYFSVLKTVMNNTIPLSNNVLINGKMNYPCANTTAVCKPNAGIAKFKFTPGKKYRLRLINTSAEATMKFTIDGHNFTIFANDFTPVVPYKAKVVTLGVGQRTDVVVEATGKAGDSFYMRSEMGNALARQGCSFNDGVSTQAVAAVYYDGADTSSLPTTTSELTTADLNACSGDDLSLTKAFCKVPLATDFETVNLDFRFQNNGTNLVWLVNNQTFRANMNVNILDNVVSGNRTFDKEWNVYSFKSKKALRVVMNNFFQVAHPMHLHGHDFNVLHAGSGLWDGTIVNADNTQVRDVQMLAGSNPATGTSSHLVIQFNQDNPGIWPLHCHIAWHVSQGLYINVLERPDDFTFKLPQDVKQTKLDYDAWTSRNVVEQIDSGL